MSEMIERVARAIRKEREMSLCGICDRPRRFIRCSCQDLARAAIEAMRNPTEAMLIAVGRIGETTDADLFRAMIDAALKE